MPTIISVQVAGSGTAVMLSESPSLPPNDIVPPVGENTGIEFTSSYRGAPTTTKVLIKLESKKVMAPLLLKYDTSDIVLFTPS
jgi:hypothetical protein